MNASDCDWPPVLHVVTPALAPWRAELLAALRSAAGERARVVLIGGQREVCALRPDRRVSLPMRFEALAAARLRQVYDEWRAAGDDEPCVHVWDAEAAGWCGRMLGGDVGRMIVDVEPASAAWQQWQHRADRARSGARPTWIVSMVAGREEMVASGASADQLAVIAPAAPAMSPPGTGGGGDGRATLRDRLGVSAEHVVLVALPPVERDSGAFHALWAALIVWHWAPQVRFLLPSTGQEAARMRALVESCDLRQVCVEAPPDLGLTETVRAADVALLLPRRPMDVTVLAYAQAAGCQVVAADLAAHREVLGDYPGAHFCAPVDAQATAAKLADLIEQGDAQNRQPLSENAIAAQWSRVLEDYRRVYERYATGGRPAALST